MAGSACAERYPDFQPESAVRFGDPRSPRNGRQIRRFPLVRQPNDRDSRRPRA